MPQYEIAGLVLNVTCDNPTFIERLHEFMLDQSKDADVNITLKSKVSIDTPTGSLLLDENIKWLRKPLEQNGYFLYAPLEGYSNIPVLADIDHGWQNGIISYHFAKEFLQQNSNSLTAAYQHILMGLIGVIFRNSLFHHNGIVIHSSAIDWEGKGIIFSAPSGTGKSTQAKLWQEFMGDRVRVLNDDTPAVCLKNGDPYIFGTPWCGSSFIHCNASAPLRAIIMLEQAQENSISKLSKEEVILRLMPRVLLPYFDQTLMSKAVDIFEKIVATVPVYLLKGKPDRESVEMVYKLVK